MSNDDVMLDPELAAALDVLGKRFPQFVLMGLPAPGTPAGGRIVHWSGAADSLIGHLEWLRDKLVVAMDADVAGFGGMTSALEQDESSSKIPPDAEMQRLDRSEELSPRPESEGLSGPELEGLRASPPSA